MPQANIAKTEESRYFRTGSQQLGTAALHAAYRLDENGRGFFLLSLVDQGASP
jgi:hypothetical protein